MTQVWTHEIQKFHARFPADLDRRYEGRVDGDAPYAKAPPRIWKTIGDEIVFCCTLLDFDHLYACIAAFVEALDQTSRILRGVGGRLDVKGCGWVATFPTPNVAQAISERGGREEDLLFDEDQEHACDASPKDFDFLGKHVDIGFRLAKYADATRLVTSVELAYLLTTAGISNPFDGSFGYHGREGLKGVIEGRPYPVVYLDIDPSESNRGVKAAERELLGIPEVTHRAVGTLVDRFMRHEGMEAPVLPANEGHLFRKSWPKSYAEFHAAWSAYTSNVDVVIDQERQGSEKDVGENDPARGTLPAALQSVLRRAVKRRDPEGRADD